ncbi:MAG: CopL family metal-binding regulatory protein [Nevskiales bacterium]|nr:CopL family metal-binding regulatory protein [Nevskiales bacterium]
MRPLLSLFCVLGLLMQGLAPAWAASMATAAMQPQPMHAMQGHHGDAETAVAKAPSMPDCHHQARADNDPAGTTMPCCDQQGGSCHCPSGCVTAPALPSSDATLTEYVQAHYLLAARQPGLLAPFTLSLIRPPISNLP